jgi:pimeloyl-[acyl-carrier protein] synthase
MAASAPDDPANPLLNPQLLANPYPLYAMLRASNPVFRLPVPIETGAGIWALTRYAEVQQVLKDARFSVARARADVVQRNRERVPPQLLGGPGGLRTMLILDPPEHTRLRNLVSKAFTPRRVSALEPHIASLTAELLDAAAERGGGEMDVIRDLAEPLPAIVIAELLGVPAEDHRQFRAWSKQLIEAAPRSIVEGPEIAERTFRELIDYLRGAVATRRREPGDDLISAMIEAQEERDALTDQELLSTSFLLLLAGHETTTNLIGNGLHALLRHPEQLERLRAQPERLDGAIEEMLRYDSPVQATVRVATEDVELAGQVLPKGALAICVIGAANRDPDVFADPDRLDIGRAVVPHLSFGFGAHFCLGASLARLEARAAFRGLLDRHPTLRLATEHVEHRPNFLLRGLRALPVAG